MALHVATSSALMNHRAFPTAWVLSDITKGLYALSKDAGDILMKPLGYTIRWPTPKSIAVSHDPEFFRMMMTNVSGTIKALDFFKTP